MKKSLLILPIISFFYVMALQDMLGCKVDIVTEQGLSRLIEDRVWAEAKSLVNFTLKEAV
ncbi:hypothetical protein QUB20_01200 [Microcoleus sp. B4-C2]|uniref:hypothetical protein n=1 Tax=Microcoleus sp. B4-C2 TaxID=2818661 RepID=UPI002FCFC4CD